QAAREAARRTQCKSNMHNLGVALHSYADKHRVLPFGYACGAYYCTDDSCDVDTLCISGDPSDPTTLTAVWSQPDDGHWSGWSQILPELERNDLYSAANFNLTRDSLANSTMTMSVTAVFVGPSQNGSAQRTREYVVNDQTPPSDWVNLGLNAPTSYRLSWAGAQSASSNLESDYTNGI